MKPFVSTQSNRQLNVLELGMFHSRQDIVTNSSYACTTCEVIPAENEAVFTVEVYQNSVAIMCV